MITFYKTNSFQELFSQKIVRQFGVVATAWKNISQ